MRLIKRNHQPHEKIEKIVEEKPDHFLILPPIVIFEGKCLTWDEKHNDWIEKRPDPNNPKGPWKAVKKPPKPHLEATCWCGATLYLNPNNVPYIKESCIRWWHDRHKNCGIIKKRTAKPKEIIYKFVEEKDDDC